MLEEHRFDVELVGLELVEDELCVVGAVVVAYAGVVAADDEMRAAIVLAADCVPNGLARPRVAHRRRKRGHDDTILRVIAADEHAVGLDAGLRGDVVRLRLADERVDEQAVHGLEGALRQVLVGPVDRVAGLKADHAAPSALGEERPGVGGVAVQLREGRLQPLERRHRPGDIVVVL
jgi:hypothetical protein